MAHNTEVNAAIEEEVIKLYSEASGQRWLNIKPSGPKWRMAPGRWITLLNNILTNVGNRIAPCTAPTRESLGDTLSKPLHETRTLIDSKISCNEGAHK